MVHSSHSSLLPRTSPRIFSIPQRRAFADSLVSGLYDLDFALVDSDGLGLARGMLLLPNNRARRAVETAFLRASGVGRLLPRMMVIGDIDLDDMVAVVRGFADSDSDSVKTVRDLSQLAEPGLVDSTPLPPAIDSLHRQMILARLIGEYYQHLDRPLSARMAFRLAKDLARVIDQLYIEDIAPTAIMTIDVEDMATHWQMSQALLTLLVEEWIPHLEKLGLMDSVARRGAIYDRLARHWREQPPQHFVIAAGINMTAPTVLRLLRVISDLPRGMVVMSGLDTNLSDSEWEMLGATSHGEETSPPMQMSYSHKGSQQVGAVEKQPLYSALKTHPQYHLKYMLEKMGIARREVEFWPGTSAFDSETARESLVSSLFFPARFTERWQTLPSPQPCGHALAAAEFFNEAEEAQAIALLMRHNLETKGQTMALVTPDRSLATRVAAALKRWGIAIDDSAGRPLSQTPSGVLLCMLAEFAVSGSLSVLLAILSHPLVLPEKFRNMKISGDKENSGTTEQNRRLWLDKVRAFDLLLREPGIAPGLAGISSFLTGLSEFSSGENADSRQKAQAIQAQEILPWWWEWSVDLSAALSVFAKIHSIVRGKSAGEVIEPHSFTESAKPAESPGLLLSRLCTAAELLSGHAIWARESGRTLATLIERWNSVVSQGPLAIDIEEFPAIVSDILTDISVRSAAYGNHPRLFIWGLIEARLQRADVMILGSLNEGHWPQDYAPDPWLAPGIRRRLGLPSPEYRQGLAAHEFAQMLAAPRVIVTRAKLQNGEPAVPSRFWLRLQAIQGPLDKVTLDGLAIETLAHHLDRPEYAPQPIAKPHPCPPLATRPRRVSVTALDTLAKEPFGFYAKEILGLHRLRRVGAMSDAAWLGQRIHKLFEDWVRDAMDIAPKDLPCRLESDPMLDVLTRSFWLPRIKPAIIWAATRIKEEAKEGRIALAVEPKAEWTHDGLTLVGKADRIDRLADGSLAIVDYKTGMTPSAKAIVEGRALQLGLLALIAEAGGFTAVTATSVAVLEYWQLKIDRRKELDGNVTAPKSPQKVQEAIEKARESLTGLRADYLFGTATFTPGDDRTMLRNSDYIWLMRRDEWLGRKHRRAIADE